MTQNIRACDAVGKGMEYQRALARQNIAGDHALGREIFNHAAVLSPRQAAPVRWGPMNHPLLTLNVVGLTAGETHLNAGKLLVDFVASREGQKLDKKAAVRPSSRLIQICGRTERNFGRLRCLTTISAEICQFGARLSGSCTNERRRQKLFIGAHGSRPDRRRLQRRRARSRL